MLINNSHRKWFYTCVGLAFVAVLADVLWRRAAPERPVGNTALGLTFGISAYAIMLFEGFLSVRKAFLVWRIGRLQAWMRAHLWLGLLSIVLVCLHTGLHRGGVLTTIILILFTLVAGSGIFGAFMQHFLPRAMTRETPLETVYEQIDNVRIQLIEEADALIKSAPAKASPRAPTTTAALVSRVEFELPMEALPAADTAEVVSEPLVTFYRTELRPYLARKGRGIGRLTEAAAADSVFQQLQTLLPLDMHSLVDDLKEICEEKRQLDRQRSLHHWLHCWMLFHGPLALALLVLIAAHAFMATFY